MDQTYLKRILDYNQDTGQFKWKVFRSNRVKQGWFSGTLRPEGYLQISIDKKIYLCHKIAWLWVYGTIPEVLDHINENKQDNRISNLRKSNPSLNGLNQTTPHKDSTSKYRGVSQTNSGKWMAKFCLKGKQIYLGSFDSSKEAYEVYMRAKEKILNVSVD